MYFLDRFDKKDIQQTSHYMMNGCNQYGLSKKLHYSKTPRNCATGRKIYFELPLKGYGL